MDKIEFNTTDILDILVEYVKPTDWSWWDYKPKATYRVLGFLWKETLSPSLNEGWGPKGFPKRIHGQEGCSYWSYPSRVSSEYVLNSDNLFFDEDDAYKVMYSAKITIRKINSSYIKYFKSNTEADTFISDLKLKCPNQWQVIEK